MKSCVIFGAGAIGLAFLGDLLDQSGYRMTFADVREDVLDWLNLHGGYAIRVTDADGETTRRIRHVCAVNSLRYGSDEAATQQLRDALAEADVVFTATGAAALPPVGKVIGDALRSRCRRTDAPLNIVCCENIKDPAGILRDAILDAAGADADRIASRLGICRSVISRMTPVVTDPANIVTEAYAEIPVEGAVWLGPPPEIVGVRLVDDFPAYKMRKLIMHNMTHAVAAYLGYFLGEADVCDCVTDAQIGAACRQALAEAHAVMAAEFGLPDDELTDHAEDLFRRYANPSLGHTVPNVARDPMRKLRDGDRFQSALSLAERHGIPTPVAELGAAFALHFDCAEDVSSAALAEALAAQGVEAFIRGHMGLDPKGGAGARIAALHARVGEAVKRSRDGEGEAPIRALIGEALDGAAG